MFPTIIKAQDDVTNSIRDSLCVRCNAILSMITGWIGEEDPFYKCVVITFPFLAKYQKQDTKINR